MNWNIKKDRERIELQENDSKITSLLSGYGDHWKYKFIEKNQVSFDSEKCFVTYDVIIQRKKDKKFFFAKYSEGSTGYTTYKTDIWEVFPKEVTTTIYE